MQKMRQVLVKNGQVVTCNQYQNAKDWLSSAPRGAYTTARTVCRNSVFEFESHVERLSESTLLILRESAGDDEDSYRYLTEPARIRPEVLSCVKESIKVFSEENPEFDGEYRLTMLLTWGSVNGKQKHDLFCHAAALPDRPSWESGDQIRAGILGQPRENAIAKDSEWVRQRKHLEQKMPIDTNEMLLADGGKLFEGLSSNFYAVKNGKVITADEGILKGTVRRLILKVCQDQNIPVVLQPPEVQDIKKWDGAFLSSTSRLLLPLTELTLYAEENMQPLETRKFEKDELIKTLDALVQREILNHSTRL